MKEKLLLILLYSTFIQSQNFYKLISYDDNYPIKYANIYANNKILTSSDSLGNFSISESNLNSIIKITALGYKTLDSVSLKNNSTILMEIEPIILNDVVITNKKKLQKYKLGKAKNGNIGIVCTIENNIISQVSKLFEQKIQHTAFLDRIKFKTLCTDKKRVISIFIHSVGANGEPDKILNDEDIICNLEKGHNTYEVDLSKFNITYPENGIFISLNYIFVEQNKCYRNKELNWYFYEPSIDAISVNNYIDTWYNLNGRWKKSETYSVSMELILTD